MVHRALGCLVLASTLGCSDPASVVDAAAPGDAPGALDGASDAGTGLVPGSMTVVWMHGSANCAQNTDPELQEHAYNATTIIFRQNKCRTFEAPFVYLLVGETSALLLDTGATNTATLRNAVRAHIGQKPLIVAHTHGHADHTAGDSQFAGKPNTTLVAANLTAIRSAFGAMLAGELPEEYLARAYSLGLDFELRGGSSALLLARLRSLANLNRTATAAAQKPKAAVVTGGTDVLLRTAQSAAWRAIRANMGTAAGTFLTLPATNSDVGAEPPPLNYGACISLGNVEEQLEIRIALGSDK